MDIDISSVCQLLTKYTKFKITSSGNLNLVGSSGFYHKSASAGFMKTIFDFKPEVEKALEEKLGKTACIVLKAGEYDSTIRSYVTSEVEASNIKDYSSINYDSHVESKLTDIKYIHNVLNPRANFIYNPKTDKVLMHREPMINQRLKYLLGGDKDASEWILSNTLDCVSKPVSLEPKRILEPQEKGDHTVFNTWDKPEWFEAYEDNDCQFPEIGKDDLPEIVVEFWWDHFFLTEESREWFFHWFRDILFSRSTVMCVLVAGKGTGKNITVDECISRVLGGNNVLPIGEGFVQNHFQDGIQHNQLLAFDEFEVTVKTKNKFKRLFNARGVLEAKSIQAGTPVEFHFSMVMCSNNPWSFSLDVNDRRFSVLDITDVNLQTIWPKDKIEDLIATFRDPDTQFKLASYLYHNYEAGKSDRPLVTQRFKDICYASLPSTLQRFVEYCKLHETFDQNDFYKKRRGTRVDEPTLRRWVADYERTTSSKLAVIKKHSDVEWVAVSQIYDPTLAAELEE
jgi:hypothetical protein